MEATRANLEAQRKALLDSDFYRDVNEAADKELGEFNPYDDKSFEDRIQKEVAQRMKSMLEPMRQQQELHNQQIRLQQFKSEHPDLDDIKTDVAQVLMDNKHMNLEQAYWQVKGRRLSKQIKTQEAELSSYKKVAREAGLKVGGASRGRTNGIPKHIMDQDDPAAIYNWLKENKGKVKI
jgi:signal recognition particle subunit SEC65